MTYNYQIVEQSQGSNSTQTLSRGSFTLSQNAYKKEAVNISTIDLGPHAKVEVELPSVNESIDYLVARSAHA